MENKKKDEMQKKMKKRRKMKKRKMMMKKKIKENKKSIIVITSSIILLIVILSSCSRVDQSIFKNLTNQLNDNDELSNYMSNIKASTNGTQHLGGFNFHHYTLAGEATDEFIELDKKEKYDVFLKLVDVLSENKIRLDLMDCGKKERCMINTLQLKHNEDVYEYKKGYYSRDSNLTLNEEEIYKPSKEVVYDKAQKSNKSETNTTQKKYPPQIHMTDQEVLNSTWGRPNKVNKTTTEYGTREQWVYSNSRFLYFDDGVLTGIQD